MILRSSSIVTLYAIRFLIIPDHPLIKHRIRKVLPYSLVVHYTVVSVPRTSENPGVWTHSLLMVDFSWQELQCIFHITLTLTSCVMPDVCRHKTGVDLSIKGVAGRLRITDKDTKSWQDARNRNPGRISDGHFLSITEEARITDAKAGGVGKVS